MRLNVQFRYESVTVVKKRALITFHTVKVPAEQVICDKEKVK